MTGMCVYLCACLGCRCTSPTSCTVSSRSRGFPRQSCSSVRSRTRSAAENSTRPPMPTLPNWWRRSASRAPQTSRMRSSSSVISPLRRSVKPGEGCSRFGRGELVRPAFSPHGGGHHRDAQRRALAASGAGTGSRGVPDRSHRSGCAGPPVAQGLRCGHRVAPGAGSTVCPAAVRGSTGLCGRCHRHRARGAEWCRVHLRPRRPRGTRPRSNRSARQSGLSYRAGVREGAMAGREATR